MSHPISCMRFQMQLSARIVELSDNPRAGIRPWVTEQDMGCRVRLLRLVLRQLRMDCGPVIARLAGWVANYT
jgi:hypothetical protein